MMTLSAVYRAAGLTWLWRFIRQLLLGEISDILKHNAVVYGRFWNNSRPQETSLQFSNDSCGVLFSLSPTHSKTWEVFFAPYEKERKKSKPTSPKIYILKSNREQSVTTLACPRTWGFLSKTSFNCLKIASWLRTSPIWLVVYLALMDLFRRAISKNCRSDDVDNSAGIHCASSVSMLLTFSWTTFSRYVLSPWKVIPIGTSLTHPGTSARNGGWWTAAGNGTNLAVSQSMMLIRPVSWDGRKVTNAVGKTYPERPLLSANTFQAFRSPWLMASLWFPVSGMRASTHSRRARKVAGSPHPESSFSDRRKALSTSS